MTETPKGERLQKVLAQAGAGSRRACEALIEQGRVQVDGVVVRTLGTRVLPGARVLLDGEPTAPEGKAWFLVYKPRGVICTHEAKAAPHRVVDLIPGDRRLYLAGRLDVESEGLVFVTNDGALANRITHPRFGIPKTYRVKVRGRVTEEALQSLRRGVHLAEGRVQPIRARVLESHEKSTDLEVVLAEGRNREVRRIFARVGHPVKRLVRTAIGPFTLGGLRAGQVRALTAAEIRALDAGKGALGGKERKPRKARRKGARPARSKRSRAS